MMKISRLLSVLLALVWIFTPASAVNPYPQLEAKAQRAFTHAEWASASALFDLMLEERPKVPSTYGQAIVSNAMRSDTIAQMRLLQRALDNHVPFDSIFSRVRQWSFHLGKTHLYEHFLKEAQRSYPWMRRAVDARLLAYYTFRRNGEGMILYSRKMLDGAADNVGFLPTLAEGQMLTADEPAAVTTYRRILVVDPKNVNALLNLGNIYAMHDDETSRSIAIDFLEQAYALKPTPYVAATIARLKGK